MSSPLNHLNHFILTAWAVIDEGIDGGGLRSVMYLCEQEDHAEELLQQNKNAAYYRVVKTQAVSIGGLLIEAPGDIFSAESGENTGHNARIRAEALAKLNSEEKRILGIVE